MFLCERLYQFILKKRSNFICAATSNLVCLLIDFLLSSKFIAYKEWLNKISVNLVHSFWKKIASVSLFSLFFCVDKWFFFYCNKTPGGFSMFENWFVYLWFLKYISSALTTPMLLQATVSENWIRNHMILFTNIFFVV